MSDALVHVGGVVAGVLLGAVFYGGLWWTVRRVAARSQALWLFGSFLVRSTLALLVFYAYARSGWQALALCFLGFLAARLIVSSLVRARTVSASLATREAGS
jgi:F1F0 ATPase subunit 2